MSFTFPVPHLNKFFPKVYNSFLKLILSELSGFWLKTTAYLFGFWHTIFYDLQNSRLWQSFWSVMSQALACVGGAILFHMSASLGVVVTKVIAHTKR